jgi:flagellin
MSVINTNVSASIARNAIQRNERQMTQAMERLSTGMRINSAADDAAGLAISAKFANQIAGLNQAARNSNDGISMVQTAEGAFIEVGDMLQRMRQLAVQAASETYAAADRKALDLEFQALANEIVNISNTTTWNTANLLDGTAGTAGSSDFRKIKVQSGANASQTVDVDFGMLLADAVDANGETAVAKSSGELKHSVANGSFTDAITAGTTAAKEKHVVTIANTASIEINDVLMFTIQENDGVTRHNVAVDLDKTALEKLTTTGTADWSSTARISGGVTSTGATGFKVDGTTAMGVTIKAGAAANTVEIESTVTDADSTAKNNFKIFDMRVVRGDVSALMGVNVGTQALATSAITALDTAQSSVNSQRASLGSYISRFEHASLNLANMSNNMTASRSRIADADYASETTELARTQIIQQASTAMLAQANAAKASVMALLT